jgi:hypothetical protein
MRRYKGTPIPDWLPLAALLVLVLGVLIALLQRLFGCKYLPTI